MPDNEIEFVGQCVVMRKDGKTTLAIGDLHLGFESVLNQSGVFVSRHLFKEMMDSLASIFERVGKVERVVLLGDVKHDFGKIQGQEWQDAEKLFAWLKERSEEIIIVKGNHDTIIEPIARKFEIVVKDFFVEGDRVYVHGDRDFLELYEKKIKTWIMGHGHPAVKLSDGVKMESYKCFLEGKFKGKKIIIVPSFFYGQRGSDPREYSLRLAWEFDLRNFRVWIVGDDKEVYYFGLLKKLP